MQTLKFAALMAAVATVSAMDVWTPEEDLFAPEEDLFAPEEAIAPEENPFSPEEFSPEEAFSPEEVFAPEEKNIFQCQSNLDCQILGDESAVCNKGTCVCSEGFGPAEWEGEMQPVCYNPDLKVLIPVDFVAEYPNAKCEKLAAINATEDDFAAEVNKWAEAEEVVEGEAFTFGVCIGDMITYSAAEMDIFPLIVLGAVVPEIMDELIEAIDTDDYTGRLIEQLLKTEVGRTHLPEGARRSVWALAQGENIKMQVDNRGTANGKACVIEGAKTVVAKTVSDRDICFASECLDGFEAQKVENPAPGAPQNQCVKVDSNRAIEVSDDDLSSGAIAGVVVGSVAVVGVIGAAAVFLGGKSKPEQAANEPIANEPIAEKDEAQV